MNWELLSGIFNNLGSGVDKYFGAKEQIRRQLMEEEDARQKKAAFRYQMDVENPLREKQLIAATNNYATDNALQLENSKLRQEAAAQKVELADQSEKDDVLAGEMLVNIPGLNTVNMRDRIPKEMIKRGYPIGAIKRVLASLNDFLPTPREEGFGAGGAGGVGGEKSVIWDEKDRLKNAIDARKGGSDLEGALSLLQASKANAVTTDTQLVLGDPEQVSELDRSRNSYTRNASVAKNKALVDELYDYQFVGPHSALGVAMMQQDTDLVEELIRRKGKIDALRASGRDSSALIKQGYAQSKGDRVKVPGSMGAEDFMSSGWQNKGTHR